MYPYALSSDGENTNIEGGPGSGSGSGQGSRKPADHESAQTKAQAPTQAQSQQHQAELKARRNIARLIPVFEDDPKARFLFEVVENGGNTAGNGSGSGSTGAGGAKKRKVGDEMGKVTEDGKDSEEPRVSAGRDETMDIQQGPEESSDSTNAIKPSAVDSTSPDIINAVPNPSAQPNPITNPTLTTSAAEILKRKRKLEAISLRTSDQFALSSLSYAKFWELMGYRQECASGDVTGFFSMMRVVSNLTQEQAMELEREKEREKATPRSRGWEVSQEVFARMLASLLNYDFGNRDLAIVSSEGFLNSVENIVGKEIGLENWSKGCVGRVERNALVVDKKVDGVVGGSGGTAAPVQVNVLQVKKKKKPLVVE